MPLILSMGMSANNKSPTFQNAKSQERDKIFIFKNIPEKTKAQNNQKITISKNPPPQTKLFTHLKLSRLEKLIFNAVGEGIYGIDQDGLTIFFNPAAEKILGWKSKDLIGLRLHDIIHRTKNDAKTFLPYNKCPSYQLLNSTHKKKFIENQVFWRQNGTPIPVEYSLAPIIYQKKLIGAVGTFHDITHKQKLENLKNELLSSITHELKTPITTLKLLFENHLKKVKTNTSININELIIIDEELSRLSRLINNLLDNQKLENSKFQLNLRLTNLNQLIKANIQQLRLINPKQPMIYKPSEPIKLYIDSDKISQVIINLLTNAIKFSPSNKKIFIKTEKLKKQILISIRDQGRGVPAKLKHKIFTKYFQIKNNQKASGFGLGLYISKKIIKNHKGKLWIESKTGEGSIFKITLPLIN